MLLWRLLGKRERNALCKFCLLLFGKCQHDLEIQFRKNKNKVEFFLKKDFLSSSQVLGKNQENQGTNIIEKKPEKNVNIIFLLNDISSHMLLCGAEGMSHTHIWPIHSNPWKYSKRLNQGQVPKIYMIPSIYTFGPFK